MLSHDYGCPCKKFVVDITFAMALRCRGLIWQSKIDRLIKGGTANASLRDTLRVLFENRPALYFCNYIFITAHKMYNFWFRIKDTVYFFLLSIIIIMILILKILLHNVYKIINLRYPTYVYPFLIFLITRIECWPVFKQDPIFFLVCIALGHVIFKYIKLIIGIYFLKGSFYLENACFLALLFGQKCNFNHINFNG